MSVRYTVINTIESPQAQGKVPIILIAGNLLKEESTGQMTAQVKFQSISEKSIKAVYASFSCFGAANEPILGTVEAGYADLCVKQGDTFGDRVPVALNSPSCRGYKVRIVKIQYEDGSEDCFEDETSMEFIAAAKDKERDRDKKINKKFRITAAVLIGAFAVFLILTTCISYFKNRTFTVTYYDENGTEYFPMLANEVWYVNYCAEMGQPGYAPTTYEQEYEKYRAEYAREGYTADELADRLRIPYKPGETIADMPTPDREGYRGVWVPGEKTKDGVRKVKGDIPSTMGTEDLILIPEYTIGIYTVKLIDNGVYADTAEDNVIFELTAEYGTAIDYGDIRLPELDEYYVFYSTYADAQAYSAVYNLALPETIPGSDLTLYVNYAHGNFIEYYAADDEGAEREYFPQLEQWTLEQAVDKWENDHRYDYESYFADMNAAFAEGGEIYTSANEMYETYVAEYTESGRLDKIRQFVPYGEWLELCDPPVREGFDSAWDIEAPAFGDGIRYRVHAVFTPAESEDAPVSEDAE